RELFRWPNELPCCNIRSAAGTGVQHDIDRALRKLLLRRRRYGDERCKRKTETCHKRSGNAIGHVLLLLLFLFSLPRSGLIRRLYLTGFEPTPAHPPTVGLRGRRKRPTGSGSRARRAVRRVSSPPAS